MHENLHRVFFSNFILKDVGKDDEKPCLIVTINTFLLGVTIQVTQVIVVKICRMLDNSIDSEHEGYPSSMLVPNDNSMDLLFYKRLLHLFNSHFVRIN